MSSGQELTKTQERYLMKLEVKRRSTYKKMRKALDDWKAATLAFEKAAKRIYGRRFTVPKNRQWICE